MLRYGERGLYKLETLDLFKILLTPKICDLTSENGLKQIKEIGILFADFWSKNPEELKKRIQEGIENSNEIIKLLYEKAKSENNTVNEVEKVLDPILKAINEARRKEEEL